jgi:hypothetical protein
MATIRKRVSGAGVVSWTAQVRLKGHPTESATFHRKRDAKKWGEATETAIREGRHFTKAESKKHTVSELVDRYVSEILPRKPKSVKQQGQQLEWWKNKIGDSLLHRYRLMLEYPIER